MAEPGFGLEGGQLTVRIVQQIGSQSLLGLSKQLLALPRQGGAHVPYKDPSDINMTCKCRAPEEATEARPV